MFLATGLHGDRIDIDRVARMRDDGLPPLLVDWAQVVGVMLSLLALAVAFYALWRQKRDLGDERKRQHDLDILRSIGSMLRPGARPLDIITLIVMLQDDFRLTREAFGLTGVNPADSEAINAEFRRHFSKYLDEYNISRPAIGSPGERDHKWKSVTLEVNGQKSVIRREFEEANRKRLI